MLIGPQGPPWWIFFQIFFKNVLVYPLPTQKYVLWHPKEEKSILGRRELKEFRRHFQPGLWNLREPLFEALVGRDTAIKCQPRFCKILSFYTQYFYFFCFKTMIFEHFPKRGRVGCKFDNNCSLNVPKLDQIVTN